MKKTITFFKSLLLAVILLVGSGSVYGATETISSFISLSGIIGTNVSYASFKGGGTSDPVVNTSQIRLYQNAAGTGGGFITVSVPAGYKISAASIQSGLTTTVAYSLDGSGNTKLGSAGLTNTGTYTASSLSASSVTFHCMGNSSATRLYVKNLSVTYEAVSSCTTPTTSFASASVSKLTTDAAFTNAFTSNNTSTKVWSSTNEAVATVDSNGEVTIVGAGSTNIRVNQAADATYCAVVDASYALTVTAPGVAEPTNQPTELSATTNSTSQITVTWTDATGAQLPEHYLVKASTGTITAPVDGTAEADADAALVKNIAQGTQTAVFTGLDASTTYNFSIWPYTNSGAAIDYKTDGTIATASATTETPLGIPVATAATDISATGFTANWGAAASATGYDVNIYTKSNGGNVTETEHFDGITPNGNLIGSATYLTDWSVSSQGTRQIYTSTGNYGTSSPSFAFTTTGDYIQTATYASPIKSFSFWAKQQSGATSSTLIEGYNGSTWSTIATLSNADVATAGTTTYDLVALNKLDILKIKMTFTKVAGNISIDDITVTYGGSTNSPISGSPFAVSSVTTKAVSGLNPGTEYFYTVVAKNASGSSAASNEISVTTDNSMVVNSAVNASTLADCATCNITIADGGHLTVDAVKTYNSITVAPQGKLTNTSTLTVGTITIQSDANGTGTIVGNVSGNATVNQYLKGDYRTWYLSSPVANAQPANMGWIKYYNEADGSWPTLFDARTSSLVAYGSSSFVDVKGYLVVPSTSAVANANIQFVGELNTGNKSIALTNSVTNTSKPGFNLVGNPYPSYLKWADVYAANISKLSSASIWYRTKQLDEYVFWTVNGDGVVTPLGVSASSNIPPMQAFWVKTTAGGGTLELTNNMRSHANATGFLLKAPAVDTRTLIRLQVSNGTNTDEAVLYLSDNANNGLDAFDAPKMTNDNASIAEIFTRAGSEKLVINAMRTLPRDTEIALGFEAGSATSFTLRANELSNLPSDVQLILKDNVTKAETDMTDGTAVYSFSNIATSGDRFSIIFRTAGAVTGIDQPTFSGLSAYSNANNQLTVLYDGVIDAHTVVSVYNAVGQRLVTQSLKGASTIVDGAFTPGVYVVKVNNLSRKLTIKN